MQHLSSLALLTLYTHCRAGLIAALCTCAGMDSGTLPSQLESQRQDKGSVVSKSCNDMCEFS